MQTGATRKGFAGITPDYRSLLVGQAVRSIRSGISCAARDHHFPLAAAMFDIACPDFNASLAKKNFPSLGTIMICTRSLRR
jgi:hypothetical protein